MLHWTPLLQKSTDNFSALKTLKSVRSLITATSSHKQSPRYVQIWTFPTSRFRPLCPSICLVNHSHTPVSAVILEVCRQVNVVPRLKGLKPGVQFQLSEADPLLLMALRGLRDTEPLFFQRTEKGKKKKKDTESAVLAWQLQMKSERWCLNVNHEHPTSTNGLSTLTLKCPSEAIHLLLPTSALGIHYFHRMCSLQIKILKLIICNRV